MLNTENTEQADQTETTATQLTTQNSLEEGHDDVLNNNCTEETEGTEKESRILPGYEVSF